MHSISLHDSSKHKRVEVVEVRNPMQVQVLDNGAQQTITMVTAQEVVDGMVEERTVVQVVVEVDSLESI